ncbi:ATP-grasp fold amidoligase family protein [Clostridium sp.]|uniref:ATP-grasp fold amidoligase family protein n=1 Tax=Clostridium sp. TaxID=1506 RepID=UPI002629E050|nr:ATP-grasp fold amidoligase family protein [Clostridium sp.]
MNKELKIFLKRTYIKILSKKSIMPLLYVEYLRSYKKILNLSDPKTFGEKIQWMKMNGNLERYRDFVDKFLVRSYVEKKLGKDYLVKLYGVYNNFDEIDFEELPKKFVLKPNNSSGDIIICKNKSVLDLKKTKKQLDKWLKRDFYDYTREIQYKGIERKIICEEYLEDSPGSLKDYKIFCFDGKPEFIQVDFDRHTNHKRNFYDLNWKRIYMEVAYVEHKKGIDKPKEFDELIKAATKLSEGFPFVRVDLYIVQEKVYFGELTFTPGNGKDPFRPLREDLKVAAKINLEKYL